MISGYNTDIEHDGVVYHVQTEDKGLRTPVILSLVYTGGAILASKRSPYDDLIASGFSQEVLAERLQRQHKLICAAVLAGRIEELRHLGEHQAPTRDVPQPIVSDQVPAQGIDSAPVSISDTGRDEKQDATAAKDRFSVADETEATLSIDLLEETELHAGESVTFHIQVSKAARTGRKPVAKANIILKLLGSNFQPSSTFSTTDSAGRSSISVSLPTFKTGRAAILIRAEADGEIAEVRRIIQPA